MRSSLPSSSSASAHLSAAAPLRITIPYLCNSPRIWLESAVRSRTNRARARCSVCISCWAVGPGLHEAQGRPAHGLADRGRVVAVVLVAVDVRLDLVRRQPPHRMAQLANLAMPVMCATAGFHADRARLELGKKLEHALASERPAQHQLARRSTPCRSKICFAMS